MRDTITSGRHVFRITIEDDTDHGAPWENADGHGPVSDWRPVYNRHTGCKDKKPGEVILSHDGQSARFYDFAEATRIAKRDGWGLAPDALAKLAGLLGRTPTSKEVAREAVLRDFEFLRGWCNDEWSYVGVVVTLLDADGDEVPAVQGSLWGIESDAYEYHKEVAADLASELLAEADAACPRTLEVTHLDTCLPCYLTDHCNGFGETLLSVPVDGSTTYGEVLDALRAEADLASVPDDVGTRALHSAIMECFADAKMADKFDSSIEEPSEDDDESGDSCHAYFRVSWSYADHEETEFYAAEKAESDARMARERMREDARASAFAEWLAGGASVAEANAAGYRAAHILSRSV